MKSRLVLVCALFGLVPFSLPVDPDRPWKNWENLALAGTVGMLVGELLVNSQYEDKKMDGLLDRMARIEDTLLDNTQLFEEFMSAALGVGGQDDLVKLQYARWKESDSRKTRSLLLKELGNFAEQRAEEDKAHRWGVIREEFCGKAEKLVKWTPEEHAREKKIARLKRLKKLLGKGRRILGVGVIVSLFLRWLVRRDYWRALGNKGRSGVGPQAAAHRKAMEDYENLCAALPLVEVGNNDEHIADSNLRAFYRAVRDKPSQQVRWALAWAVLSPRDADALFEREVRVQKQYANESNPRFWPQVKARWQPQFAGNARPPLDLAIENAVDAYLGSNVSSN